METILETKLYKVECPAGHDSGFYKTAITYGEFSVFCPSCGISEKVTKVREN